MTLLENHTIKLRALEPEDLEILYRWENDVLFWSAGNTLAPYSKFVLRQYMESQADDLYKTRQLRLMVELKEEGKAIGTLDMFDFDPFHNRAGIGILIIPEYQSKGLGAQALQLFIDYVFRFLKIGQLYCTIAENNEASLSLFQKQGFSISGKLLSWFHTTDGWVDTYILQLIRERFS
jgi:diamine N-acetyltransferase